MTASLATSSITHARWASDVSALVLRMFTDEAERRGLDALPLLARVGLRLTDARDPCGRVGRDAALAFVDLAIEATRDEAFHLHAARNTQIGAFGALDFMAAMAPTVGAGLARVAAGFGVIDAGVRMTPIVGVSDVRLRLEAVHERRAHRVELESTAVAFATRITNATAGAHGLAGACFTGVDRGYRSMLAAIIGGPVSYGAAEDALVVARATWDARPAAAHPAFAELVSLGVEPVLDALAPTVPSAGLVESVEQILSERLADGGLSAAQVALTLDLSERTLHRRLARAGTSFGAIVDATRLRHARAHLDAGDLSIAAIAEELGYSEPAAFTRAYRRWTGHPPSDHRTSSSARPGLAAACGRAPSR